MDSPFKNLPDELWPLVFTKEATFEPRHFIDVIDNLIKNPNITSSCVFRADILYDSASHAPSLHCNGSIENDFTKHIKEEYRPKRSNFPQGPLPGYELTRTIVRKMIPRNPALDKALVQTCHYYSKRSSAIANGSSPPDSASISEEGGTSEVEDHFIVMIPHALWPESVPFYHPKVQGLTIRYTHISPSAKASEGTGTLQLYYELFASYPLDNRLQRTAQNLVNTIHKHATGRAAGYTKRVHHDLIVPQSRFQDTYTRFKLTHAKSVIENWAEVTDPTKHVFEDLGIAAFLVELWKDLYPTEGEFPGFVDIGCGNGLLVDILIQEGYTGWGFDARARKSWEVYPRDVQKKLEARILVPSILSAAQEGAEAESNNALFHDGVFPSGTFVVSNHADELTPWTPLLAYLNRSPFIAIPCCSHSLAGARCRFNNREHFETASGSPGRSQPTMEAKLSAQDGPGPASGSLARPKNASKPPSAYQSLTAYVSAIATELGFEVQREMLRIPSTRNAAIVGKLPKSNGSEEDSEARLAKVRDIVRREIGDLDSASKAWLVQAQKIAKSTSSGH